MPRDTSLTHCVDSRFLSWTIMLSGSAPGPRLCAGVRLGFRFSVQVWFRATLRFSVILMIPRRAALHGGNTKKNTKGQAHFSIGRVVCIGSPNQIHAVQFDLRLEYGSTSIISLRPGDPSSDSSIVRRPHLQFSDTNEARQYPPIEISL